MAWYWPFGKEKKIVEEASAPVQQTVAEEPPKKPAAEWAGINLPVFKENAAKIIGPEGTMGQGLTRVLLDTLGEDDRVSDDAMTWSIDKLEKNLTVVVKLLSQEVTEENAAGNINEAKAIIRDFWRSWCKFRNSIITSGAFGNQQVADRWADIQTPLTKIIDAFGADFRKEIEKAGAYPKHVIEYMEKAKTA